MGFGTIPSALGHQRRVYATAESTFKTFARPVGASAIKCTESKINTKIARTDRDDSRRTLTLQERIMGIEEPVWSAGGYLIPGSGAGVAPDIHDILKAAFGIETVNASTSVVYTLLDGQKLPTLTVVDEASDVLSRAISGAWVSKLSVKQSGPGQPMWMADGEGCAYVGTGTATVVGAVSSNADVVVSNVDNFGVNSIVSLGTDTHSGAGYKVTAINRGTNTITLETAVSVADGAAVAPYVPDEVASGSPIAGINGVLTVDSVDGAMPITACEITLDNQVAGRKDEAFQTATSDGIRGRRKVTTSLSVRARADQIIELNRRKWFTSRNIVVSFGQAVGGRWAFAMPKVEFDFADFDLPTSGEGVITLPGVALGTEADELSLTIY